MYAKYMRYGMVILVLLMAVLSWQPSSTTAQDNTITIGTLDIPLSLDPALAGDFVSWEILRHLYTGLTRQVPGANSYELAAATNHEISEDGLVHTFTLRGDLTFIDGTPITAETFANSINRVMRLDRAGAGVVRPYVLSVSASDATTLVFTLTEPVPYFEALVALPPYFATHPNDFPQNDVVRSDITSLIGNGVYTLAGMTSNERVELLANPNYQFGDSAKTERIVLRRYFATQELQTALRAHEIDLAWRDVLLPNAVTLANEHTEIEMLHVPSVRMWYFLITANTRQQDTSNIAVRQTFIELIDRERITASYFNGYLTPAMSLVPEMLSESYIPVWSVKIDGATATEYLQGAGYRPNRPVNLGLLSSRLAYGDYYANAVGLIPVDFREIRTYIQVNSTTFPDGPTMFQAMQAGDNQMTMFAWTPVVAHPDAYLRPLLHSTGLLATANAYASDEMDAALDQARLTNDGTLYKQVQEMQYTNYTLAPLWQDAVHVLHWNDIAGITIEANYFLHYDLLERE